MIRFRHKGCKSEVIRYVGEVELVSGSSLHSSEWAYPDGTHPSPQSEQKVKCPDCLQSVEVSSRCLEPIIGA